MTLETEIIKYCINDDRCKNPNKAPTRLQDDGGESQETGLCNYCRHSPKVAPKKVVKEEVDLGFSLVSDGFSIEEQLEAERVFIADPLKVIKKAKKTKKQGRPKKRGRKKLKPTKKKQPRIFFEREECLVEAVKLVKEDAPRGQVAPIVLPQDSEANLSKEVEERQFRESNQFKRTLLSYQSLSERIFSRVTGAISGVHPWTDSMNTASIISGEEPVIKSRMSVIGNEVFRGIKDVVFTMCRIAASSITILLLLAFSLLGFTSGLAVSVLMFVGKVRSGRKKLFKRSFSVLYSGLSKTLKQLSLIGSIFVDGRIYIGLSYISILYALTLSEGSYVDAVFFTSLGTSGLLGWIFFRGLRAAITNKEYRGEGIPRLGFFAKALISKDLRAYYKNEAWTSLKQASKDVIMSVEERSKINRLWAKANDEFEVASGKAFSYLGFKVLQHGTKKAGESGHTGSGDNGIDLFLFDSAGKRYIVQCKRYSGKVGPEEVRSLHGACAQADADENKKVASIPVFVTTLGYTKGSEEAAKQLGIKLYTLDELIEMGLN